MSNVSRVDEFNNNYLCSTLFDVIYPCFDAVDIIYPCFDIIFRQNMAQSFDQNMVHKIRYRRKIQVSIHVVVEIPKFDPCCRSFDDVRHNRH